MKTTAEQYQSTTTISWHAAREAAFRLGLRHMGRPEHVELRQAIGREVSADIAALCDLPNHTSSAMDGWAIAGDGPWRLVPSTPGRERQLLPGEAMSILTGGTVPAGTHTVLRTEHGHLTLHDGRPALVVRPGVAAEQVRRGRNIRMQGEEVQQNEIVVPAGTVLNPAHLAVIAASGHDTVPVERVPRVALIYTGDEVVESGIPPAGSVRNSFDVLLPALVGASGALVLSAIRAADTAKAMRRAIELALDSGADVIVTTGATGASAADHLRPVLEQLDGRLVVSSIAMRPGGPSFVAELPGERFLVALPGNPLAAVAAYLTLAHPLLSAACGASLPQLGSVSAASRPRPAGDASILVPFVLREGVAVATPWHGSAMLRGLADADGLLVFAPGGAEDGAVTPVLPLPWTGGRDRSRRVL